MSVERPGDSLGSVLVPLHIASLVRKPPFIATAESRAVSGLKATPVLFKHFGHKVIGGDGVRAYVRHVYETTPQSRGKQRKSCRTIQLRMFYHLDYEGRRWTWELFKAHWWDRDLPDIYIGRWPD